MFWIPGPLSPLPPHPHAGRRLGGGTQVRVATRQPDGAETGIVERGRRWTSTVRLTTGRTARIPNRHLAVICCTGEA